MSDRTYAFKPCPFCGKTEGVHTTDLREIGITAYPWTVTCGKQEGYTWKNGCGAHGGYYATEDEAIDSWNRRVNSED